MKKYLWLVALVAALTFVFVGCGGGGGPNTDDPIIVDGPDSVTLDGNFRYGTGYQGLVKWSDLINQSIKAGDTYELELEFTVSRDLESKLMWVLVDTSPDAGYWKVLTGEWKKVINGVDDSLEGEPDEGGGTPPSEGDIYTVPPDPEAFKATDTISYKGKIMAVLPGPAASSNLAFQSDGSGIKGGPGGGDESADGGFGSGRTGAALGPITLNFTKFTITRLAGDGPPPECECDGDINECDVCGENCDCETCELPPDPDFANGTGTKLLITVGGESVDVGTLTTITGKNNDGSDREPIELKYFDNNKGYSTGSRGYGNGYSYFKVDFGSGTLADYASVNATFQGISGDINWKNFCLWASGTEPTFNYLDFSNNNIGLVETRYDGLTPREFTFNLASATAAAKVAAITESEVYFIFQIHGADAAFKISNIEFVLPGDGPCECEGPDDCICGLECDCEACVIPPDPDFAEGTGTKLTIMLGTTSTDAAEVKEIGDDGVVEFFDDNSGYLGHSNNYGAAHVAFKVDFGAGKSLADYESVTFDYQGVDGDIGWKVIYFYASAAEPSGYLQVNGSPAKTAQYNNDGKEKQNFEVDITGLTPTDQEVWFIINIHAGVSTFKVSNIVFVPAEEIPFVPVTGITISTPGTGLTGTLVTLAGTVEPEDATHQDIVWSVKTAGAGVSTITGNTFTATTPGTLQLTATIVDGTAVGTPYTKDFNIVFSAPYVAVTNITGVPLTGVVGTAVTLSGTVEPGTATAASTPIAWSLVDAGGTGVTNAQVATGAFTVATTAGTVKVRATITNGATAITPYTQDFEIVISTVAPPYVAVTSITGVPTTGTAGTAVTLTGTVNPTGANGATNRTIAWSIVSAGTTGVTELVGGNTFTATGSGTITVRATITNGASATTDYTENFSIVIYKAVSSITNVPTTGTAGTAVTLSGTVNPTDATNQTIAWSLVDAGGTGVTNAQVATGTFTATAGGTITVRATITNGATATTNFTDDFEIVITGIKATITVAEEEVDITVTVSNGLVAYLPGNVGYQVIYNPDATYNDNGNVIGRFMVDLGDNTLADFEKVTFTWQGVGGDIGYKKMYLLASDDPADITGYKSNSAINDTIVSVAPDDPDKFYEGDAPQVNGTTATPVELTIEDDKGLSGEVWFAFFIMADVDNGGVTTSFKISDIEFVLAE
jgi:hypothetical protein